MLAQLLVENKHSSQLEFEVYLHCSGSNVLLPQSSIKEMVFGRDEKVIAHFMKVDPEMPFAGRWTITVQNNWQPAFGEKQRNQGATGGYAEDPQEVATATNDDYELVNNNNSMDNYQGSNEAEGE